MNQSFKDFLLKFEDEFDDIDISQISPTSLVSDFIEINSLNILVISTVYEFEYKTVVPFDKIKAAITFKDLYELIDSKK